MSADPEKTETVGQSQPTRVTAYGGPAPLQRADSLAVEEPLEIQVIHGEEGLRLTQSIAVTMRTPGHDFELALGFLFTEGVIPDSSWVRRVGFARDEEGNEICNRVQVALEPNLPFDPSSLTRHTFTNSSCGICGKITIEAIRAGGMVVPPAGHPISSDVLRALPDKLRRAQPVFEDTGGLHASALFDIDGELLWVREDVGRHNALDKLIGRMLMDSELPASERVLLVSGRASFELVQKAVMAGIPIMAAVGAPSSLAVDLAREFKLTLAGFLREDRFNLYSGQERCR